MLGRREPEIYGSRTYADLESFIHEVCSAIGAEAEVFQSNHEGAIVDKIQQTQAEGIVINPAAYTHTSIAILDALKAVGIPAVEVHLSDPAQREVFRHVSYPAQACSASFVGLGFEGYAKAIEFLHNLHIHTKRL